LKVRPEEIASRLKNFSLRVGRKLTKERGALKERYTITGDIISYSLCPRQYGLYRYYGFAPSNPSQEWFGSVIHRFLKRVHTIYRVKGRLIRLSEVEPIFSQVETSMEAEGARPSSPQVREKVVEILKAFTRSLAQELVPKIVEAELRLVKELPTFILYGVVDALKAEGEEFEIWDYKGMERPDPSNPFGRKKLEVYTKQMFVYAYLFKERNGSYPKKAVLLFMNELLREGEPFLEIDFTDGTTVRQVEEFIEEFARVVERIEESKKSGKWELPEEIDRWTCLQCDFRHDCPKFTP
jgi:putative RecB family exonuclease